MKKTRKQLDEFEIRYSERMRQLGRIGLKKRWENATKEQKSDHGRKMRQAQLDKLSGQADTEDALSETTGPA